MKGGATAATMRAAAPAEAADAAAVPQLAIIMMIVFFALVAHCADRLIVSTGVERHCALMMAANVAVDVAVEGMASPQRRE
eukprot:CAMPEP_0183712924 /NCGR_PEP_ID=MMETSP0737-20130205/7966_1 /TAXON_ID=385413 /ORGANISM="Thalassiosira miniscula, Strain CCMP1093" /LENGTH=80 /DNA_ID=CAMNT_0025941661 /DNA_START=270 /DNA_END=512 /DNA_ORIENTATION=+